jgi:hypothetical protein
MYDLFLDVCRNAGATVAAPPMPASAPSWNNSK